MEDIYTSRIEIAHGITTPGLSVIKTHIKNGVPTGAEGLDMIGPEEVLKVCDACLRWLKGFHPEFKAASAVLAHRIALVQEVKDIAGAQEDSERARH